MVCKFVKGKNKKKKKQCELCKIKKKPKESQINQYFVAYWKEHSGIENQPFGYIGTV